MILLRLAITLACVAAGAWAADEFHPLFAGVALCVAVAANLAIVWLKTYPDAWRSTRRDGEDTQHRQ